ncbi:MAG: hypothetical protein IJN19_00750 [Opitutales bacterium]|nr:hypothetical protein [Opitutales bacterium]
MQNFEQKDDDFSDIEDALMKMRPVEPSERFYASVEAAMNEPTENAVVFPHRGGFLNFVSLRRFAASAAFLAATVGMGIWGYSVLPDNAPVMGGSGVNKVSAATGMLLAAGGGAQLYSGSDKDSRSRRPLTRGGNYNLVNVERRMNVVEPFPEVDALEDGTISRRVRYVYMDEYRWEDSETGAAFVELRPHEKIVSMEMPIY